MKPKHFAQVSKYFRSKRLAVNLTQQEVSTFLGYSNKQIVSNWERGICAPPIHQMPQLIGLFKLDAKEVLELFMEITRSELTESFMKRPKKKFSR
jgi:transcriptional regulator with XRE-family HTH domain